MTPDPYEKSAHIKNPGSWNRYAFVNNDPINRVDPHGLNGSGGGSGGGSGSTLLASGSTTDSDGNTETVTETQTGDTVTIDIVIVGGSTPEQNTPYYDDPAFWVGVASTALGAAALAIPGAEGLGAWSLSLGIHAIALSIAESQ